jgi:prepilin peptidase CpaA
VLSIDSYLLLGAVAVALTAAAIDVQQHRIPNRLTYPAMVAGVLLHSYLQGWRGARTAMAGLLLTGGLVFLFYAVNAMGAGDLKLFAALGAIAGPSYGVRIVLSSAIAGGFMAIVYALYRGRLRTTLVNVGSALKFHAWAGVQAHPELNLDNPKALRMPYGLAIATGTLYTFLVTCWR